MLVMQGLILEEFGGDIQAVPISALKGTNINELMDAIVAQAEILNLRADYEGFVEGVIIESKMDKHRGYEFLEMGGGKSDENGISRISDVSGKYPQL